MAAVKQSFAPFEYKRAEIPAGDALSAEILVVDEEGYFYLAFCDTNIQRKYDEMVGEMRECADCHGPMKGAHFRLSGMACVIECPGVRGGGYVRGIVLKPIPDTIIVKCQLVDDMKEVRVYRAQLYPTTFAIASYPQFALKCKLAGMECFEGYPFLQKMYEEYSKKKWNPSRVPVRVQVLDPESPVPTVKLTNSKGRDLTDLLQQYIPTTFRCEYRPKSSRSDLTGKVTFCDTRGNVWFQPMANEDMLKIVKSRLQMFTDGWLGVTRYTSSCRPSWKDHFFQGSGAIFIYKCEERKKSYRARIINRNVDNSVQIFFVDYGEITAATKESLVPAYLVDPNLCFIPPQCLPFRFEGAERASFANKEFDLDRFWRYVGTTESCTIALKDICFHAGSPKILEEDRIIPASFVDPHLNFIPPECTPVRFLKSGFGNITQQIPLVHFWEDQRKKPVPAILEKFKLRLDKTGKFKGGVIAPIADIFVTVIPPGYEEEAVSNPEEFLESLDLIYRELESVPNSGPVVFLRSLTQGQNSKSEESTESGLSNESGVKSGSSSSGNRDGVPHGRTWVDWAMKILRQQEQGFSCDSGSSSDSGRRSRSKSKSSSEKEADVNMWWTDKYKYGWERENMQLKKPARSNNFRLWQ